MLDRTLSTNILIITNAGTNIGIGHLNRCLSLKSALEYIDNNLKVYLSLNNEASNILTILDEEIIFRKSTQIDYNLINELKPKIVIIDSYLFSNNDLIKIKKNSFLTLIDDNNDIYDSTIPDLIINANIHAKDLDYHNPNCLLGVEYLIMNPVYWNVKDTTNKEYDMLITTGGTDYYELSYKILSYLKNSNLRILCIVGPSYSVDLKRKIQNLKYKNLTLVYSPHNLLDFYIKSEFVISASGSSVYESLVTNCKPIIFSMVDNQEIAYTYFVKYGIPGLGSYPNINFEEIGYFIRNYPTSKVDLLRDKIDGGGAIRLAQYLRNKL